MDLSAKLAILAGAAKYDASCASSGSDRKNSGGLGNAAPRGICHSWSADGRCVSLLKVLMTNVCAFDCAYCANRASNDIPRAAFTAAELVALTVSFYCRNYIEGLFLSSGIPGDPDEAMARMTEVAYRLRNNEGFNGYIHLKAIPGASLGALRKAGSYADRLSVNIELASEASLNRLAPQKTKRGILGAMGSIDDSIRENREDSRRMRTVPAFAPAGQSTQLIVGASPDTDERIISLASSLYRKFALKRVYYSAFMPVRPDPRLPNPAAAPLRRENRLYQADWLMRFYGFGPDEILAPGSTDLNLDLDPKTAWAIRNPAFFPIDLASADYDSILRVPGIGVLGSRRIVNARRFGNLSFDSLRRMGIAINRSRGYITIRGKSEEGVPRTVAGKNFVSISQKELFELPDVRPHP
jgi:putative DNA modification/repair radical SAM protein